MVKEPVAGRVKTRLARVIGSVAACAFYRRTAASTIMRLSADTRWRTILAIAPDTAVRRAVFPAGPIRTRQGGGDLGRRMQRIFERRPPGPVLIVGTDIPGIERGHIAAAFKALGGRDAVFGPASDGGYWLIGLKRLPRVRRAFAGVRWSTEHALADTMRSLDPATVALIDRLSDVDVAEDLAAVAGLDRRLVLPKRVARGRKT